MGMCSGQVESIGECPTRNDLSLENAVVKHPTREAVSTWQVKEVIQWATQINDLSPAVITCLQLENIDGPTLLNLSEEDIRDLRYRCNYNLRYGDMKKLWRSIITLQEKLESNDQICHRHLNKNCIRHLKTSHTNNGSRWICENCTSDASSIADGSASNIPPEFFKTAISLGYSFLVTWITSFVMVIVHERVPDMKRYPPLPDIFLDNVPHIPWAFHMCEITGTVLFVIWTCVCIFHTHRMVLLRRFFALAGTVFLLRCVTMLITSLSVPGTHLQCNQNDYAINDNGLSLTESLYMRVSRAYSIWSGLGMSIQGVRTCGDYMFSGHTVALTLLNFFITEYTPRRLYFLHTLTWLLNMFGIFFILAAHEHYSIDVFVAFYITSRLFLYYHTLANNQALMQRDSTRTRIWFPMFSYFESSVNGIIPNEYDSLDEIAHKIVHLMIDLKDFIMLTAHRVWLETPRPTTTLNGIFSQKDLVTKLSAHTGTISTQTVTNVTAIANVQAWTKERSPTSSFLLSSCINADDSAESSNAAIAADNTQVFIRSSESIEVCDYLKTLRTTTSSITSTTEKETCVKRKLPNTTELSELRVTNNVNTFEATIQTTKTNNVQKNKIRSNNLSPAATAGLTNESVTGITSSSLITPPIETNQNASKKLL